MEPASKNLRREQDLYAHKVSAQKEVEEAEVNYELKKKDYENALAALKVFQIEPDQLVLGQPMIVRSPISGEIVKNNIVIGQFMKDDADPVAHVLERRERDVLELAHGGVTCDVALFTEKGGNIPGLAIEPDLQRHNLPYQ